MNLTRKPNCVDLPAKHYVYIEKFGPFQETAAKAWKTVHEQVAEISKHAPVKGYMSLYKMEPQMTYRAGIVVDAKPLQLPEGFQYVQFTGGKYTCFVLTGSYSQLPEACGRVFATVKKDKISMRDDFFIENYVKDPETTPEDQLITEILIPTV